MNRQTPRRSDEDQLDEHVRRYNIGVGTLDVYRDDDEYLAVHHNDRHLEERHPAKITDIEDVERVWAIPENWSLKLRYNTRVEIPTREIYEIDDTGELVEVSLPKHAHPVDASFFIKDTGSEIVSNTSTSVNYDEIVELRRELLEAKNEHEANWTIEINALDKLLDNFDEFEKLIEEGTEMALCHTLRKEIEADHGGLPGDTVKADIHDDWSNEVREIVDERGDVCRELVCAEILPPSVEGYIALS